MSTPPEHTKGATRWLLPAVAAGLLVAGSAWAWQRVGAAPQPDPREVTLEQPPATTEGGEHAAGGSAEGSVAADPDALPIERSDATPRTSADMGRFAQGLRGVVLDDAGRSLPDVAVHLLESAGNDPLLLPLMRQQQHFLAPVASTRTGVDGTFALGLEVVQDKTYDVFAVSPRHATARLGGLRLLAGSWHELGAIMLERGATIRGRVTVEGQPSIPVPHAVVTALTGEAFADAALRAMPQDDGELVAQVDAAGYYELQRVPSRAVVRLSAVAPGFARVTRRDVEMHATEGPDAGPAIVVDFELPTGHTLVGTIHDRDDQPVAGARIAAWPEQRDQDPLVAFTDEHGAFRLHGLRSTDYRLRATANGFEPLEPADLRLDQPMRLTMVERDRVQVVARTRSGRVLRSYVLDLRRFFPKDASAPLDENALQAGSIGAVPEVRRRAVQVAADVDHAELRGVPQGLFVVVVEAEGFAPSMSLPFRCDGEAGGLPRTVEVVVTRGVTLLGRVLDERGAPVAGAIVTTQDDGAAPDNALFRVLRRAAPGRSTARKAATDANGWFRLERLAPAAYQLQIEHPEACRRFVRGLRFADDAERTLPPITLERGATVRGRATHDGRVAAQMKVVLATPATAEPEESLRLETITDADGHYAFGRRVPPGDYVLRASVVGQQTADREIFQQLLQLQRSSITFSVPRGRDVVDIDYDLPSAN